jgi:flagellar protein FliO/FliZ
MKGISRYLSTVNRLAFGSVGFAFLSQPVVAQTANASMNASPSGYLLQILFSLALIIGLILVLAWVFKRSGIAGISQQEHLKVVAGISVGTREKILVVQVGQDQILVGVTAGQINTLHQLPEPLILEEKPSDFAQKMAQVLGQMKANRRIKEVSADENAAPLPKDAH